jgi:hypothetical protein
VASALKEIYEYFLDRGKPLCFNPYDDRSVLINGEKEFEDICNSMEDSGVIGVRESTVFEFYSKVQYLERKIQKMKPNMTGR